MFMNRELENLAKEAFSLETSDIISRLKMSPEERIEAHENARLLMEELFALGESQRVGLKKTP